MSNCKLLVSATVLSMVALVATGCNTGEAWHTPDEYVDNLFLYGKWRPSKRAAENQVELITIEHAVNFGSGESTFGAVERQRLTEFLNRSDIGPQDKLAIYGPRRDKGMYDVVTAERIRYLQGELNELGATAVVPLEPRTILSGEDQVSVMVTRSVVISPDCRQPIPARGRMPRYKIGCSTNANLGQMVADPLDLQQGRPAGTADGEAASLSIQRYRRGETRDLENSALGVTN